MSTINDPDGQPAAIGSDGRLQTAAKSSPLQHIVSEENQQAYQVRGHTTLVNGTATALHVKNISTTKNMIITYIRLQIIDPVATVPSLATYANVTTNLTVASGGASVTSLNMYVGHSNAAEVTATSGSTPIVPAGTAADVDHWFPTSDGDANTFNKEGVLIIPPQQAITLQIISDAAGGELHTRISFIMEAPDT